MKKVKAIVKRLFYFSMGVLNFKILREIADRNLLVINYHSIYDVDEDARISKNIYRTEEEFEQDIVFLKKHYQFISLPQLLNYLQQGTKLPPNSVFLTFDDGLKVVYDKIRPILNKHQVSAAFFLNPSFVDNADLHFQRKKNLLQAKVKKNEIEAKKQKWKEIFLTVNIDTVNFHKGLKRVDFNRSYILNSLFELFEIDLETYQKKNQIYLNSTEIEQMISEGFVFGGHSMDHPNYDELSFGEQKKQTLDSIYWVRKKYDLVYSIFAFPLRDHNISQKLLKAIQSHCEVSFGVMGLGEDVFKNHIQRIDAESNGASMIQVLKFEYLKYITRKIMGIQKFKRPVE
ncbi:hypothetical protein E9993_08825 [Labilibacter sediminis]|nr:hypothetical protein E9993_08825 [Labilibacter sediminis]